MAIQSWWRPMNQHNFLYVKFYFFLFFVERNSKAKDLRCIQVENEPMWLLTLRHLNIRAWLYRILDAVCLSVDWKITNYLQASSKTEQRRSFCVKNYSRLNWRLRAHSTWRISMNILITAHTHFSFTHFTNCQLDVAIQK